MSIDLGSNYSRKKLISAEKLIEMQREALGRPKLTLADLGPIAIESIVRPPRYKTQFDLNKANVLADASSKELGRQVGQNQSLTNYFDSQTYYNKQSTFFKPIVQGEQNITNAIEGEKNALEEAIEGLNEEIKALPLAHAKATAIELQNNPVIVKDVPAGISEDDLALAFKNTNIEENPFEIKQTDANEGRFPVMADLAVEEETVLQVLPRNKPIRTHVALMKNNSVEKTWILTPDLLKVLSTNTTDVSEIAKNTYMEIIDDICGEYIKGANATIDEENLNEFGLANAQMFLRWYERSEKFEEWIAPKYDIMRPRKLERLIEKAEKEESDNNEVPVGPGPSLGPVTRQQTRESKRIKKAVEDGHVAVRKKNITDIPSTSAESFPKTEEEDVKTKDLETKSQGGKGVSKTPKYIILSPKAEERFQRLNVLLGSKIAGNNVGLDEFTSILDSLLEENKITKKDYSRFMKAWKKETKLS